jgi:hypothetical protein
VAATHWATEPKEKAAGQAANATDLAEEAGVIEAMMEAAPCSTEENQCGKFNEWRIASAR